MRPVLSIFALALILFSSTPTSFFVEGKNSLELKDILVGGWLVAGQSNMERLLSETANGAAAIAAANHPTIRLFNVSRSVAFKHAAPPLGIWQAAIQSRSNNSPRPDIIWGSSCNAN